MDGGAITAAAEDIEHPAVGSTAADSGLNGRVLCYALLFIVPHKGR